MNQEFFKSYKSAFLKRFLSIFLSRLLSVKRLFKSIFQAHQASSSVISVLKRQELRG